MMFSPRDPLDAFEEISMFVKFKRDPSILQPNNYLQKALERFEEIGLNNRADFSRSC